MILRNQANPFYDAVSVISGVSGDPSPPAGQAGLYRAPGLTPGAQYIVGVNQIPSFASGGSGLTGLCSPTPPTLPGPEEFYNGPQESADPAVDNPACFCPVTASGTVSGIDVILNSSSGGLRLHRLRVERPGGDPAGRTPRHRVGWPPAPPRGTART